MAAEYDSLSPEAQRLVDKRTKEWADKLGLTLDVARRLVLERTQTSRSRPTHGAGH